MSKRVRRLTELSVLTAIALIIFVIELQIPNPFPIPGIKLGLANIAILVTMCTVGKREALMVAVYRSLLILAFGGNIVGFGFSLLGGVAAGFTMYVLIEIKHVSIFGVSIGGAAMHAIGQIVVAMMFAKSIYIVSYLPWLMVASSFAGGIIAFLSIPVIKALDHIGNEMIQ